MYFLQQVSVLMATAMITFPAVTGVSKNPVGIVNPIF
jgi:hypothetical protein